MHGRLLAVAAFLVVALAAPAFAVPLYATDGTTLQTYESGSGSGIGIPVPITALGAGETIVGIDVDATDGQLYAYSSDDRLYELAPDGSLSDMKQLAARTGTAFGMDIDPVTRRIHMVSDAAESFSFTVDGDSAQDETPGPDVALAFTNAFAGAASSTQYGIAAATGALQHFVAGAWTTGGTTLGLPTPLDDAVGFDIRGDGVAYGAFREGATTNLRSVDLTTGTAGTAVPLAAAPALTGIAAPAVSVVNMNVPTLTVDEGVPITLQVKRSGPLAGTVSLGWTSTGGDTGNVDWSGGDGTTESISIANAENDTDEPDRTFTVTLGSADGVAVPARQTVVTVLDDDTPPVVTPPTPTRTQTTPPPAPVQTPTTPVVPPRPPRANPRPKLTVPRLSSRRLSDLTTRRGLTVKVTTNEACRLTAELRIPRTTAKKLIIGQRIARTRAQLRRGRQATVKLVPVVQIRNKLRRLRSVKATVWLTCADNRGDAEPPKTVATTLRR